MDHPNPDLDGDFDNGVIAHEYGHGISNRLTGGPANVSCLQNDEQAGEGWSDFYAYMLNMPTGTEPAGGRGIGTYVLGQATNGAGIRTQRYSTNMGINTMTYDSIKTAAIPHGIGSVWAEMLWEVTYALIGAHGFSADLDGGPATAGNILALQLVTDGLKLQPCSPGFVTARNAIIAADQAYTGGANRCILWTAFAKRGLGSSATQGSSGSRSDGTQAFDLPASCLTPPAPTVTGSTPSPGAVTVAFTSAPGAGITSHTAECVSTDGGATGTQSGAVSPITVAGLTPGKSYHCRVSATNLVAHQRLQCLRGHGAGAVLADRHGTGCPGDHLGQGDLPEEGQGHLQPGVQRRQRGDVVLRDLLGQEGCEDKDQDGAGQPDQGQGPDSGQEVHVHGHGDQRRGHRPGQCQEQEVQDAEGTGTQRVAPPPGVAREAVTRVG